MPKNLRLKFKLRSTKTDWYLITTVISLVLFGVLMVFNASSISALTDFGNKFYYLREQSKWVIIGVLGLLYASFFDYKKYFYLALPLLLVCLLLLILVFVPGLGVNALGAHRWINFHLFILQPSEFTKLSLIIYLSAWFSQKEKKRFFAFLLLLAMIVGLIILQPDMGTGVVLVSISLILYFVSGAPLMHFGVFLPLGFMAGVFLAITSPYRLNRVLTFFNSSRDPLGASYHVRQILIALGSGGLLGLGFGKSRQKFAYLPEATTDSIFAIIAEELGFIGSTILILVFLFLIYRIFSIAKRAPDNFGRLLAVGIGSWFAMQIIINLGAMVALIPLTGIPLPFISYGGSSLVVALFAVGILINIKRQGKT
ncbi:putative lipid II flippase FtsW [Candidatus Microgenomates bacterium]|nr:putative lipid II flippase FtsW [Candidatus Microgenomates bacterium]